MMCLDMTFAELDYLYAENTKPWNFEKAIKQRRAEEAVDPNSKETNEVVHEEDKSPMHSENRV